MKLGQPGNCFGSCLIIFKPDLVSNSSEKSANPGTYYVDIQFVSCINLFLIANALKYVVDVLVVAYPCL